MIFEENIILRIIFFELRRYFIVEIVFLIFGFPVSPIEAKRVFDYDIWTYGFSSRSFYGDLRDKDKSLRLAIFIQEFCKRLFKRTFIGGASEALEVFDFGNVSFD